MHAGIKFLNELINQTLMEMDLGPEKRAEAISVVEKANEMISDSGFEFFLCVSLAHPDNRRAFSYGIEAACGFGYVTAGLRIK